MLLVEVPSLLLLCLSAAAAEFSHQMEKLCRKSGGSHSDICVVTHITSGECQQGTTVTPGEDATLQCHCPSDAAVTMLEWTRLEQKSDGYVFFFRNKRLYEDYQHLSFRGRVELSDPEMKDGDVSVTLKNVTINDTGTYTCGVTSRKTENGEITKFNDLVSLTVTDSVHSAPLKLAEGDKDEGDNGGGNEDGRKSHELVHSACGTIVGLLLIIGVVVVISYKSMNKHTCGSYQQAPLKTEA